METLLNKIMATKLVVALKRWLYGKALDNKNNFKKPVIEEVGEGITITMEEDDVKELEELGKHLRSAEKETLVIESPWGDISTFHFEKGKCVLKTDNKAN